MFEVYSWVFLASWGLGPRERLATYTKSETDEFEYQRQKEKGCVKALVHEGDVDAGTGGYELAADDANDVAILDASHISSHVDDG